MLSIIIPSHDSPLTAFFLGRLFKSIANQTYKDYEIILVKEGLVGHNLNVGIKKAKGELIKIMCQDDWFSHQDSLKHIVDNFKSDWMITGCDNNPNPKWTEDISQGNNKLGGLSVITFKNQNPTLFDERLLWLIDIEWYVKMYKQFGMPTILNEININIGLGNHQTTNRLSEAEKLAEYKLIYG